MKSTTKILTISFMLQNASASTHHTRYLRQRTNDAATSLTFAPLTHYMWSGGLCSTDNDCNPKIRTRTPETDVSGATLCGCYANSVVDPLDECQGEYDGCGFAACFVNSCFGMEAYCDVNKGICALRSVEEEMIRPSGVGGHAGVSWGYEQQHEVNSGVSWSQAQQYEETTSHQETTATAEVIDENATTAKEDEALTGEFEDENTINQSSFWSEEVLSMPMQPIKPNSFVFQWLDTDTTEKEESDSSTHETTTTSTTLTTFPDDGDTDFSWVAVQEEEKMYDETVVDEFSMSMVKEVVEADYTWYQPEDYISRNRA